MPDRDSRGRFAKGRKSPRDKYNNTMPQKLIDFFCASDPNAKESSIPTISGFCITAGISLATFADWLKRNAEFARAYEHAKAYQQNWIFNRWSRNKIADSFAKFMLINGHGYAEKVDQTITYKIEKAPEDADTEL